ncbi:MAG: LON peptidase substrate-binding domain-containing protein [Rhodoferax sp.]|nr:LON peptidase substrate-binding domain-containing protein [Rhodoferax sp.]MCP5289590.1 LON peptidase substrate-binding domain-containing protein [Burkholderiaceae bacterium]
MAELPLFPLRTVLFPGGILALKVFEARYLDLVGRCLRSGEAFGIVCLADGPEAGAGRVRVEDVGTRAIIEDVDADRPGILYVRCRGGARFRLASTPRQQADGLWTATVDAIADDPVQPPAPAMRATVAALSQAIESLDAQQAMPASEPLRLDDAGWVANRWCELLPIPLAARYRLMALEDPALRLSLVDEYLRGKQVVGD